MGAQRASKSGVEGAVRRGLQRAPGWKHRAGRSGWARSSRAAVPAEPPDRVHRQGASATSRPTRRRARASWSTPTAWAASASCPTRVLSRRTGAGPRMTVAVSRSPRTATGRVVWFTGLCGAGKSTLARRAACTSSSRARRARPNCSTATPCARISARAWAFREADRDTNVRRIGFVAGPARPARRHGAGQRHLARMQTTRARGAGRPAQRLLEIFVDAPLATRSPSATSRACISRPSRARSRHFTGVSPIPTRRPHSRTCT